MEYLLRRESGAERRTEENRGEMRPFKPYGTSRCSCSLYTWLLEDFEALFGQALFNCALIERSPENK